MGEENKYLLDKINFIRESLDKMTDLCENEDFLNKNTLQEVIKYLETNADHIITYIEEYYIKNKEKYNKKIDKWG